MAMARAPNNIILLLRSENTTRLCSLQGVKWRISGHDWYIFLVGPTDRRKTEEAASGHDMQSYIRVHLLSKRSSKKLVRSTVVESGTYYLCMHRDHDLNLNKKKGLNEVMCWKACKYAVHLSFEKMHFFGFVRKKEIEAF